MASWGEALSGSYDSTATALRVTGGAAAGSANAGSPTKIGAVYNSTKPTYTDGQIVDLQATSRGMLGVTLFSNDTNVANTFAADNASSTAANSSANKMVVINRNTVGDGTNWYPMKGDSTGSLNTSRAGASIANGQVSVTTSSTQVVAARATRKAVRITNLGTTDVFIGVTGVTTTTGDLLVGTKGASVTIFTSAAVFAVVGTGTQSVSFMEEYN